MQEAHVALQEHLRNASRAAEVAVNLEGSVCIPQVVERAVLKQVAIELVGVVAIELVGVVAIVQTGPLAQLPAHRPACCPVSSVLTPLHSVFSLSVMRSAATDPMTFAPMDPLPKGIDCDSHSGSGFTAASPAATGLHLFVLSS